MPKQKELHYFTYPIISKLIYGHGDREVSDFFIKNFEDYKDCYKRASNEIAIGDASPSYINHPSCIPEIKEKLGRNTKIIVLLRDPIKRAYSNYLHLVREDRETLSFFDALQQEEQRKTDKYGDFWYYTFNSFYYEKIKAYKKDFDEVLLITSEELNEKTLETLQMVYGFLGVDSKYKPENIERRYNLGGVYDKNFFTNLMFKQSKLRNFIKQIVPITPGMKHLKHKITGKYKKETPKIDEKSESYLLNLFKNDVKKLKEEFGVNVNLWNKKFKK